MKTNKNKKEKTKLKSNEPNRASRLDLQSRPCRENCGTMKIGLDIDPNGGSEILKEHH